MNDAKARPVHFEPAIPKEVGGWLLFFCIVLTIIIPAQSLYQIFFNMIPRLTRTHEARVTVLLVVHCILLGALAAYSGITGFSLWTAKREAVVAVRRFLWTLLFSNFAYFCFWIVLMKPWRALSFAERGWYHVVGPIGFFWFWYVYLEHSKRVRSTYVQ